jgi:hypothetical protein
MTASTKRIFILSLVTFFSAAGVLGYLLYEIEAKGATLESQIAILNENTTKESAYVRLRRLAQETEDERSLLASSFFKGEGDSITFLGEIETLAAALNISLKTEDLAKITKEGSTQEYIRMSFVYEGQRDTVFTFSKLFEVVPYHSIVESLQLRQTTPGNWEGTMTILITIQTP